MDNKKSTYVDLNTLISHLSDALNINLDTCTINTHDLYDALFYLKSLRDFKDIL